MGIAICGLREGPYMSDRLGTERGAENSINPSKARAHERIPRPGAIVVQNF